MGGFTRALMEVLVVDDHTGSYAGVVHSVAVGVPGHGPSFSFLPRLVSLFRNLGATSPLHRIYVGLNTYVCVCLLTAIKCLPLCYENEYPL